MSSTWAHVKPTRERAALNAPSNEVGVMDIKKLFQVLVVGGAVLGLSTTGCGGTSSNTDTSGGQQTGDGGTGVHGW